VSAADLFALSGAALFGVGLWGFVARRHFVRRVLAVNVLGSGVFLVLLAVAARPEGEPDPVPAALVLTGLVVSASATALALALGLRAHADRGALRLPEDE
jgi:multicomponent Na+:H+ antiporter subunit C